mmetsp:Transcript_1224/g.3672  ORF Transcript_1224/g.3672 Transcript_1224/m.3672 type:complete len:153 (+) Transcript_1224:463-921(+)
MDFEPLRPIDQLLSVGCFAGFSNVGHVEINNGLIGAVPGHPILLACLRDLNRAPPTDLLGPVLAFVDDPSLKRALAAHDAAATIQRTGPGFFTRLFCRHLGPDALCLPPTVFYPAPNHADAPDLRDFASPATLAIHHWARSWQSSSSSSSSS